MAETNYHLLAGGGNSPFLLQLYSMLASKQGSVRHECNPLAQFAMPINLMDAAGGQYGAFTDAAVSVASIRGDSMKIYHDLRDDVMTGENDSQYGEDDLISPQRESLSIGSGEIYMKQVFLLEADWTDAKKTVKSAINIGFRMGRIAAAMQGERMMTTVWGMRGINDNYETDKHLRDAPGTSIAAMATSAYAQKINELQAGTGGEVVRPTSRNFICFANHNNDTLDQPYSDAMLGAAYTDDDAMQWDKLFGLKRLITESGNVGRAEYPFHPAMISGLTADGGKTREVGGDFPVLLTNHREIERLQEDDKWETAQNNLALRLGKMTGLFTGDAGFYRGIAPFAFDKAPVIQPDVAKSKVAVSVVLGKGALIVTYGNVKRNVEAFPRLPERSLIRKFMETVTPVKVDYGKRGGTRGTQDWASVRCRFGCIRPAFKDRTGAKKDYGVIGVFSAYK